VQLYLHSHIRLHGVVLNKLSIGTTLTLPFTNTKGDWEYGVNESIWFCHRGNNWKMDKFA
jgi:hypothetical protein